MEDKRWRKETKSAQAMVMQLSVWGFSRTKSGKRKLRLFACGCCRLAWEHLADERLRRAVETAERFADGQTDSEALNRQFRRVDGLTMSRLYPTPADQPRWRAASIAAHTCVKTAHTAAFAGTAYLPSPVSANESTGRRMLCDLLRCVFGNPLSEPVFPKKWRSETVTALAAGIYEGRAFDRLPILADALEEVGCDHPAMLSHLRGDGPHCRGCWVLDLALGK